MTQAENQEQSKYYKSRTLNSDSQANQRREEADQKKQVDPLLLKIGRMPLYNIFEGVFQVRHLKRQEGRINPIRCQERANADYDKQKQISFALGVIAERCLSAA